ncbi:MAG TPA: hypothetical protein VNF07_00255 [Acidimicrobiales bacterium]|nr:hypothetical protein [Acidimicrobiales bacterium]
MSAGCSESGSPFWTAPDGELPSDVELEALALGRPLDELEFAPAVTLYEGRSSGEGLLPGWYMPPPIARYRGGWRRRVIAGLVLALLLIEAAGLCVTYGPIG